MAILPYTKHGLFFFDQIALCEASDGLIGRRSSFFSACVVELNPFFITSDDPVQRFVLDLIFEQIGAAPNMFVLICLSRLMWHHRLNLYVKFIRRIARLMNMALKSNSLRVLMINS